VRPQFYVFTEHELTHSLLGALAERLASANASQSRAMIGRHHLGSRALIGKKRRIVELSRASQELNPIPEVEAANTRSIPSPFLCVQSNFGEVGLWQYNGLYVSVLCCFRSTVFQTT
jgi:hypothetical protein